MYACLCLNIPGTARSSATCLAMVPLTLKKKFILWSTTDGWETPPARVCLQKGRVAVNALLALSLSTFQPIILQGEGALSVIALKPTQPLMLSHASSCGSLVILIPVCFSFFHNFTQQIFFFPKTISSSIFKCLDKLHNDRKWKNLSTAEDFSPMLYRVTKAYIQGHPRLNQVYSMQSIFLWRVSRPKILPPMLCLNLGFYILLWYCLKPNKHMVTVDYGQCHFWILSPHTSNLSKTRWGGKHSTVER